MATYGVLIEHDRDGYTAWAPVIPGAYGYGTTKAEAMEHLANAVRSLLNSEPKGLAELDEEREVLGVEGHLLEISDQKRPRLVQQRLASLSEVAECLGVTKQTAWNWTRRYADFPIPIAATASGPIWPLRSVTEWAIDHGRAADKRMTTRRGVTSVAKNGPKGGGRKGAVKGRSQAKNPQTDSWIKRDTATGKFMDQKADSKPFKGVRKEK